MYILKLEATPTNVFESSIYASHLVARMRYYHRTDLQTIKMLGGFHTDVFLPVEFY